MSKLWQWVRLGYLVVPSLGCLIAGIWLAYPSALSGNRQIAWIGMGFFMGGMTVVPIGLTFLGNYFFRSERERLLVPRKKAIAAARIKKMERLLPKMYFMKRHPSVVILFCVAALILLTAMALAPASSFEGQRVHDIYLAHSIGFIFGPAYLVVLILLIYAVITKKWESYMNASIAKLEAQIAQARMKLGIDPSTSSG